LVYLVAAFFGVTDSNPTVTVTCRNRLQGHNKTDAEFEQLAQPGGFSVRCPPHFRRIPGVSLSGLDGAALTV
jgi:hypothetical protein